MVIIGSGWRIVSTTGIMVLMVSDGGKYGRFREHPIGYLKKLIPE